MVCLLLMTRDRIVGQRSSGLLFLFWLVLVIYGTIKLRTLSLLSIDNVRWRWFCKSLLSFAQNGVQDVFRFVTFLLQYVTYIAQCVLSLFQEPKSNTYFTINASEVGCILVLLLFRTLAHLFTAPLIYLSQRRPCPESEATFLSQITWWWQNGQIWYGWRHPLTYDDLADLNVEDKSAVVTPQFQKHWANEIKKARYLDPPTCQTRWGY